MNSPVGTNLPRHAAECPERGGGRQFGSVSHVTAQEEQKLRSLTRPRAGFQEKLLALFTLFLSILPVYAKKMDDHEMRYAFIPQKVYSVHSAMFY